MQVEKLQGWLKLVTREHNPDTVNWERVVDLVHKSYRDGTLSTKCMCQIVVLLPKGNIDYMGIGLIEVLCHKMSGVINICIGSSITYHDVLHGSRAGRGTGTASIEDNLIQKLIEIME